MDDFGDKSGKPKFMWTTEMVDALIAKYKEEEVLWNPRLPDYSKRDVRRKIQSRIAEALGDTFTALEVHEKIKNIRTYYLKELSKSAKDRDYSSCWRYFDSINAFLRPTITLRKPLHVEDTAFQDSPDEESVESKGYRELEQYQDSS